MLQVLCLLETRSYTSLPIGSRMSIPSLLYHMRVLGKLKCLIAGTLFCLVSINEVPQTTARNVDIIKGISDNSEIEMLA